MHVRFYRQRPDGPETIGTLTLEDGSIIAKPADAIALKNVLARPLEVYRPDGPPSLIDPTADPVAFLKALPTVYHGTYFWAKVED